MSINYQLHSTLTNPGKYKSVLQTFSSDLSQLVRQIQGILIHPYILRYYNLDPKQMEFINSSWGTRTMEDFLDLIGAKDYRKTEDRLVVNCRNFAIMTVAVLGEYDIPARLRVGFVSYLSRENFWYEHRIAEYYNQSTKRWIRVDAQWDEAHELDRNITINPLDLNNVQFRTAAQVWKMARRGEIDPNIYGDGPDEEHGVDAVAYALLHDLLALNKIEVLGCDDTGVEQYYKELDVLDEIAEQINKLDEQESVQPQIQDEIQISEILPEYVSQIKKIIA